MPGTCPTSVSESLLTFHALPTGFDIMISLATIIAYDFTYETFSMTVFSAKVLTILPFQFAYLPPLYSCRCCTDFVMC